MLPARACTFSFITTWFSSPEFLITKFHFTWISRVSTQRFSKKSSLCSPYRILLFVFQTKERTHSHFPPLLIFSTCWEKVSDMIEENQGCIFFEWDHLSSTCDLYKSFCLSDEFPRMLYFGNKQKGIERKA